MSVAAGDAPSECLADLQDVAALYAAQSVRVRRLVCLDVQATDAVIEDACQLAWMRLVLHCTRIHRETAARWVVRVAVNEARRQLRRGASLVSLDELGDEPDAVPLAGPSLIDELAERRERLRAIRELPVRQRRLVWLQGLGYSYDEMAGATGDSRRTVERQLLRAKHALAQAGAA